jgi:hypothetical protein
MGKAGVQLLKSFKNIFKDDKSKSLINQAIRERKKVFGLNLKSRILKSKYLKKIIKL